MAKQGFKVIDSDIHVVEPADLWLRYLEPEFVKARSAAGRIRQRVMANRRAPGAGARQYSGPSGRHRDPPGAHQRKIQEIGRREGEDHSSPVDMLAAMDTGGTRSSVWCSAPTRRTPPAPMTSSLNSPPRSAARLTIGCAISATPTPAACCPRRRWRCTTSSSPSPKRAAR